MFFAAEYETKQRRRKAVSVVAVAQLVESRIVIPVVVGSSPISHPNKFKHLQQNQADVLQILEDEIPKFGR
ncbi:hypothetical protein BVIET440_290020 [Burkholderia vietnamiensis]